MIPWIKFSLAFTLLVVALACGPLLSGFVLLQWLGLPDVTLHWLTYGEYFRARDLAQVAPYATTIELSGVVGFGVPLLAGSALLVPLLASFHSSSLHVGASARGRAPESRYTSGPSTEIPQDAGEIEMQKALQRAAVLAGLAMTAVTSTSCAADTATQQPAQVSRPDPVQQRARVLLEGLLVLIKQSETIADFTPAHIGKAFGVHLRSFSESDFGYTEKLDDDWTFNIERIDARPGIRFRWDFTFDTRIEPRPALTRICALDYDEFIARLEAMGLTGGPIYVEHGHMQRGAYRKKGLAVAVYPHGEGHDPIEKIGHKCITRIQID